MTWCKNLLSNMSRINWKPNDRLVCNCLSQICASKIQKNSITLKNGELSDKKIHITDVSTLILRTNLRYFLSFHTIFQFWFGIIKVETSGSQSSDVPSFRNSKKSSLALKFSAEKDAGLRKFLEFFRNLDGWIWSQKMCSTSEILNDSKEPRHLRFDKNIFDYANPDYKNSDFTNTKFCKNFGFFIAIFLIKIISPAYQFHKEVNEIKTWRLF